MADDRQQRYTWGKGDIKVQLPQCGDCAKNQGPVECEAYGIKPDKYTENQYECPEKITKT